MKRMITAIAVLWFGAATILNAQKVGHLDVDSLLRIWPAYQQMVDSLRNYHAQLRNTEEQLIRLIYEKERLIDSMKGKDSPLIAALRQSELAQMKSNYEQFILLADQEAAMVQANLSDTLYKQLNAAISRVAKAKGYAYILDSSRGGQVMYASPGDDVFDLVRQELGIPAPGK